ncbi:hypothetical protein RGQ29_030154 [Quercus rubra]|uniref:ADF-H domain-containing protein n=1 Tax=Quercus rubra TaxID=3512 RepID=A0AAN7EGT5_QUERU|nr:hypothetical protein RGQ29_030154 [Quercus rubra]
MRHLEWLYDECKLKFLELKVKRNHWFIGFKIENQEEVKLDAKLDLASRLNASLWRRAIIFKAKIINNLGCKVAYEMRSKMVYATSKDRFKRDLDLDGIQVKLQATDPSKMSLDIVKGQALLTSPF